MSVLLYTILFELMLPSISSKFTSDLFDFIFYVIGAAFFLCANNVDVLTKAWSGLTTKDFSTKTVLPDTQKMQIDES